MSKTQQIEVARYELHFYSFTVEQVNDKHYLVVYRKVGSHVDFRD